MSEFFSKWLSDAETFFTHLKTLGGEFDSLEMDVQPPLSTRKLCTLSESLPQPIPSVIREILSQHSAKVTLQYCWMPPTQLVPVANELFDQEVISGGGVLFDAASMPEWMADCKVFAETSWLSDEEFQSDQQLWLTSFPFLRIENGDYLAVGSDSQSVNYLSHDDKSHCLALSLEEFLAAWQAIGYAGPESWVISHFLDPNTQYLSKPNRSQATQLLKVFGKR